MAYFDVEPFGERIADLRAALISHTIANSMARKKDGSSFALTEFLLFNDRDETPRTPEEILAKARLAFAIPPNPDTVN